VDADVIVIGSRAAGATTAMLLARNGLQVIAVDRAHFPSDTLSSHQLQLPGAACLLRWGLLDRKRYPVKDCHGITEDRNGRIVMLTNDRHNNLIAYTKAGGYVAAWESRFPAAHALEIYDDHGEDRYWITDHDRQVVSMCTADGRELRG
jgi:2-polyprenyl-6-methoxyphenol hydroxylase-like FAD-dependent oxidoreductase